MPHKHRPFNQKALVDLKRKMKEAQGPEVSIMPESVYVPQGKVDLSGIIDKAIRNERPSNLDKS